MTMSSTSTPLAPKTPQSLAASRGSAVIVNPALEIRTLARRSWDSPILDSVITRASDHMSRRAFIEKDQVRFFRVIKPISLSSPRPLGEGRVRAIAPTRALILTFSRREKEENHCPAGRSTGSLPCVFNCLSELTSLRNLVSQLFRDFGCEPIVGDFFESDFTPDMAALGLNGFYQYVHADPSGNAAWAQGGEKLIVGFVRGLSIHLEQLDDQIDCSWLGFLDFVLGLLQRANDAFGFVRPLLDGSSQCRKTAAGHVHHGADIQNFRKPLLLRA